MDDVRHQASTRAELVEFHRDNHKAMFAYLQEVWPSGPTAPLLSSGVASKISFSRWSNDVEGAPFEIATNIEIPEHVVTVPLRPTNIYYQIGKKTVHNGSAAPGSLFMFGPRDQHSRILYREPFDTFRLYPSTGLIAEAYEGVTGRCAPPGLQLFGYHVAEDKMLRHLVMAALAMSQHEEHGLMALDSLGLALAVHLVGVYCKANGRATQKPATPLASWRLRRVTEYIDSRLGHDVSLAELSAVAGLSRMHFAAQFKAATGVSPHVYVVQKKVSAALTLLSDPTLSVDNVANALGFKSNTHFVRAFQRVVGMSPTRWRRTVK